MPARSVCLVTLSLSEAGPGRFGGQVSVTDIYHTIPYHTIPYHGPERTQIALNSPANTYYQARPVITIALMPDSTLGQGTFGIDMAYTYYPVSAWSFQLRAYAMPSVPVPPITLLTDMVVRCRLLVLAAHGTSVGRAYR